MDNPVRALLFRYPGGARLEQAQSLVHGLLDLPGGGVWTQAAAPVKRLFNNGLQIAHQYFQPGNRKDFLVSVSQNSNAAMRWRYWLTRRGLSTS